MLKLTKKADYALMAMKHLAERVSDGALSAKDVADAYAIPPEALPNRLRRDTIFAEFPGILAPAEMLSSATIVWISL